MRKMLRRFFVVLAILLIVIVAWGQLRVLISRTWPDWSWRNGSSLMQRHAAVKLSKTIVPGMSMNEVMEMLGPGSKGWPNAYEGLELESGVVTFNVRADYNWGIIVKYKHGRVVSVDIYD